MLDHDLQRGASALPTAAAMAWWGGAWLAGGTSADELLDSAVRHGWGEPASVLEALAELRRAGARGLRLVLPVAGDPFGLAGPAAFNQAVLDAGQGCIGEGGGLGLLAARLGDVTLWSTQPAVAGPADDLRDADRALRQELLRATDLLVELRLVRTTPELADELIDLRRPIDLDLPTGTPPEAAALAGRAVRLLRVVRAATRARGLQGVTAADADRKDEALRSLGGAGRRALMAACSPVTWPPALASEA